MTVVGPTYPTKGGIAQHTDALVDELTANGVDCTTETWAAQYPNRLYPGQQNVSSGRSEQRNRPRTYRRLRWFDPTSWIRAGIRARSSEVIVLAMVVPIQIVALSVITLVGRFRRPDTSVIVVAHNVLPHEGLPFDRMLVKLFLRRCDRVIAHTDEQGELARTLGAREVVVASIPPHFSPAGRRSRVGEPHRRHIAFFGLVRDYKGVDTLVKALPLAPNISVSVHGEFWVEVSELRSLAEALGVSDRVSFDDRYVSDESVPEIFDSADALVLPYRSGTASQFVLVGHHLGVPVVATEVGSFPDQISHDVNGMLCPPDDPSALATTLENLYAPGRLDRLRHGAFDAGSVDLLWEPYLAAICEAR